VIAWHDYTTWPGVTDVLNEYYKKDGRLRNLIRIADTTIAMGEVFP